MSKTDYITALIKEIDRRFPSNGVTSHAITWETVDYIGDVLVLLVNVGDCMWPHRINPADLCDDPAEAAEKIVSQFVGRIDMEPEKLIRFRGGEHSTMRSSHWRMEIGLFFYRKENPWGVYGLMSLTFRTSPNHWRAPDVSVFAHRDDDVPLAVFEVGEEDAAMTKAIKEYEAMGVPQIWRVDPEYGSFTRYLPGDGMSFNETKFSQGSIEFELAEFKARLQWQEKEEHGNTEEG